MKRNKCDLRRISNGDRHRSDGEEEKESLPIQENDILFPQQKANANWIRDRIQKRSGIA